MNRPNPLSRLGNVVLVWTIFTTTFLWTVTMRGFFRTDLSVWSVGGLEGSGRAGTFWVFPALAGVALFAFYLHGRRRLRGLFHLLLLAWHGLLALIVASGMLREGGVFEGAMWGVRIPLWVLIVPFVGFLVLAVVWVVRERRGPVAAVEVPWSALDLRSLVIAVLLLPVVVLLFRAGEGIDGMTRLATAATILQWILLTQALSAPRAAPSVGRHAAGVSAR